jgi:phosphatidate phosphatase PAH1
MLILVGFLFTLNSTNAQKEIHQLFDSYSTKENVVKMNLSGSILDLLSGENNIKSKVESINLLVLSEENKLDNTSFRDLNKKTKGWNLDELVKIKDGKEMINFYSRGDENSMEYILMLIQSEESTVILQLNGTLFMEDLEELDFDIDGMEHLKKAKRA